MDEAELVATIATVVAMTLCLHVILLFELRWQGRLLEELKKALQKQGGEPHPELAPPNPRAAPEIEAEIIEDSKAEWDRRLAARASDEAPPTQPSARSRSLRSPRT